ncbi:MAG: hypothetical protein ACRDRJ_44695, partial [Streptosporangiaceae bacterium]
FTASDGTTGQPYILLGTPPVTTATQAGADTLALAPSQGGEVPAGTTSGGLTHRTGKCRVQLAVPPTRGPDAEMGVKDAVGHWDLSWGRNL